MNTKKIEIPIDEELKEKLLNMSLGFKFNKESFETVKEAVPSLGTGLSLFVIFVWLILNWLLGFFISYDFRWDSEYGKWILFGLIFVSFVYSFYAVVSTEKPNKETQADIKRDISLGMIEQYTYDIVDLKVFEEPEHGGFIYYVLTSDDEVIALFDSESQDLSINGEDPKGSSFLPRKQLIINKTVHSKLIVDDSFSGELLAFPEPKEILKGPDDWPMHGEVNKCKWDEI